MSKRSRSCTANEELVIKSKQVKNTKINFEYSDADDESKPEDGKTTFEDKQVKKARKSKLQANDTSSVKKNNIKVIFNDDAKDSKQVKKKSKNKSHANDASRVMKNKKILFNDGDEETIEAEGLPIPEKEEDVKDEDIDKFCDELTEEDNEQYENWVKLIEAKLTSNKKKPK